MQKNKGARLPSPAFIKNVMKGHVIIQTTARQNVGLPPAIYPPMYVEHSAGIFGLPLPWRAYCCAILRNEKCVEYVQGYPAGGDKVKKVANLADDFSELILRASSEANYAHLVGEAYILYLDNKDMSTERALALLQVFGAFRERANWQIERDAAIAALMDIVYKDK
jgi:hypothetical protein